MKADPIGRPWEVAALAEAVRSGARLLALHGPAGVGKLAVATGLREERPELGRRIVVAVLPERLSRGGLLDHVARSLRVSLRTNDRRVSFDRIARALESRPTVLVLDGPEEALPEVSTFVEDVLATCDTACVVLCAWQGAAWPGAQVIRVPPLSVAAAQAWLEASARRAGHHASLPPEAVAQLVDWAGGLPDVLDWLGSRIATLGLSHTLESIRSGAAGAPGVEREVATQLARLPESARNSLIAMALREGPFHLADAARLSDPLNPANLLATLVSLGLVERVDPPIDALERPAFVVPRLVRIALRQSGSGLQRWPAVLHARWVLERALAAKVDPSAVTDRDALRAEGQAAWSRVIEVDPPLAAALAVALDPLLVTFGREDQHRDLLQRSIAEFQSQGNAGDRGLLVDLHLALARVDVLRGRFREGLQRLDEADREVHLLADPLRQGWVAAIRCYTLRSLGRYEEARRLGLESSRIATERRDPALLAMAEQALGGVALAEGDASGAVTLFEQARAAARLAGSARLEGIAEGNLARALSRLDDLPAARDAAQRSSAAFARAGDTFHLARLEVELAHLEQQLDPSLAGDERLQRALDGVVQLADAEGEFDAREGLVRSAVRLGDRALAQHRFELLTVLSRLSQDASHADRTGQCARLLESRAANAGAVLRVSADGRHVLLGPQSLDFARRGPVRRLLVALVRARLSQPGVPVSVEALQEAAWPGERLVEDSGAARVYMAVRRLRDLGLEALLRTEERGYLLDPTADVGWSGPGQPDAGRVTHEM